ncbi:hypothetical protein JTE90_024754 [Oedothorax gibbosus]|uniref:Uncharacterized protein n=1 Tax=Oedothorax gibbosus TaxID=931172 RepID=A0AAV6UCL1_9ARAC|nr:hypothetical protein JTE90_024754 [Oedothorax gibbosus]
MDSNSSSSTSTNLGGFEKLYEEWRKLQKNATRVSKSQDEKIKTFKSILDDLFDVAHQDALKNTSDEDRQFLILQRQKGRVGCMAVLISCGDEEQLIGVPEIENSKGLYQSKAVFSEINKWGAAENIEAMCFDTTAANTGCWKGTCTLLEQYFEKHLLYLACRLATY